MRILLLLVLITGYCDDSCGKSIDHPAYGIMANGEQTYYGAIACPPEWEFGTIVIVPELGVFRCADRGHLRDNHIDIWYPTCEKAIDWGVRKQTVMVIERRQP